MKIKAILFFLFYSFILLGQEFTTIIEEDGWSFGQSIYQDEVGNYYCAAAIDKGDIPQSSVLKFDKSGRQLWEKEFYDGGSCYGILPTNDQNFITLTFGFENDSSSYFRPVIIKFDSSGDMIWSKFMYPITDPDNEVMINRGEIIKLEDGDFMSYTNYMSTIGISGIALTKFNQEGDELWSKVLGWEDEVTWGEAVNVGDNIYVLTNSKHSSAGERVNRFIKFDFDGNLIEEIVVDHNFHRLFGNPISTSQSEVLYSVTGSDTTLTVKIDTLGQLVWKHEMILDRRQSLDIVRSFETSNGGFRSLGIFSPFAGSFSIKYPVVLDFDKEGNLIDRINLTDIDEESVFSSDGFFIGDTLVFTGLVSQSRRNDFIIAKKFFGEVSSTNQIEDNDLPFKITGNPSNEKVVIAFDDFRLRSFQLFDYDGKKTRQFMSSSNNVNIPKNGLPTGLYWIRVSDQAGKTGHGKIIFTN